MMSRFFRRIGVTFKKRRSSRASRIGPDVKRHRARWRTYQGLIDPKRLVFIDETWTKTNMTRLLRLGAEGRATGRQGSSRPLENGDVPRRLAQRPHRRAVPLDGPINGERFRAYVEQFLVPTLKPGDVVILDNLGSHKGKAVRQAIRAVGARLVFLPKYSPDLNPIEQVFAKFKALLRKAGRPDLRRRLRRQRAKSSPSTPPTNAPHTSRTLDTRKAKSKRL